MLPVIPFAFLILESTVDVPVLLATSVLLTVPVPTEPLVTAYFNIIFIMYAVESLIALAFLGLTVYVSFEFVYSIFLTLYGSI